MLRPVTELAHLGKPLPLLDGPAYVTGKAIYGADIKLPGMLTAVIARPPAVGGKVARFDPTRALAVPGVRKVIEMPQPKPPYGFQPWGGLAVVADHTWAAMRGRAALDVTWDPGPNGTYDSDQYREALSKAVAVPGTVARKVGDTGVGAEERRAACRGGISRSAPAPHADGASRRGGIGDRQ